MSTEHITDEIAAALEAARNLRDANEAERRRLLSEQEDADRQLVDNLTAAAALAAATQQQHEDESADRNHRLAQANRIAGLTPTPAAAPDPEPQAPAEPAQNDGNGNDPGNPPTAVQPAVPAEPAQNPLRNLNPRNWNGLAWLLAILGAFVGLIIARVTYDPMWSNVHNGFWHGALVFLWFVALAAAGFFTGGWIGASIEERQNNRNTPAAAA